MQFNGGIHLMRSLMIATVTVLGLAGLGSGGQPAAPGKSGEPKAPEGIREQAAIKQLIERGGKHWSSPARATIGGTEHLQGGRSLYIWPAEDRVYPSVRNSDQVSLFGVKFNWALQPGEKLASQNTGQYYRFAPVALPKTLGWDFTKRLDERAKSGSFEVLLGAPADKLKGEQDFVFAIFLNARVTEPASNFVKVRVRLPE
jgi:hypothetical protein